MATIYVRGRVNGYQPNSSTKLFSQKGLWEMESLSQTFLRHLPPQ